MTNEQSNHILLQIIGPELYQQVQERLPGVRLTIPKRADTWAKNERNAAINADYAGGMTVKELASKYDLRESSVYRILGKRIPTGFVLTDD